MRHARWLLLLLAACDSSGDDVVPDAGYDATQDSPHEAAPDVSVDAQPEAADAGDEATDAQDEVFDAPDDAIDANDADVVEASIDAATDATTDAGGCASNSDCLSTEYCDKGVGNCNGSGACMAVPVFCPNIVSPVCGCDGTTYNNSCKAHRAATSVNHAGSCP